MASCSFQDRFESLDKLTVTLESVFKDHVLLDPATKDLLNFTLEQLEVDYKVTTDAFDATVAMEAVKDTIMAFVKKLWFKFIETMRTVLSLNFTYKKKIAAVNGRMKKVIESGKVKPNVGAKVVLYDAQNLFIHAKMPSTDQILFALEGLRGVLDVYVNNEHSYNNKFIKMMEALARANGDFERSVDFTQASMELEAFRLEFNKLELFQDIKLEPRATGGLRIITATTNKSQDVEVDIISPNDVLMITEPSKNDNAILWQLNEMAIKLNEQTNTKQLTRDIVKLSDFKGLNRARFSNIIRNNVDIFVSVNRNISRYVNRIIQTILRFCILSMNAVTKEMS